MKSQDYWVIKIENVPSKLEDELSGQLFEIGASGVQENLLFEQKHKGYLPEVVETDIKSLLVYFEVQPDAHSIQDLQKNFPQILIKMSCEQGQDWLEEWKKGWVPFALTDDCWVVPTWHQSTFKGNLEASIVIDPGMAFGTGTHGTTQLAAQLITNLAGQNKISKAVDVGSGSGILAILMEKLGVESIAAYDIDPESQRVFTENLALNKCRIPIWEPQWSKELHYDFIVANIIDGVLLDLRLEFIKSLKVGGHIVFSGILLEREKIFLEGIQKEWELELCARQVKDEWLGFSFVRKA